MILCSRSSTSSRVQFKRALFWAISKPGCSHSTGVRRFGWSVEDASFEEDPGSVKRARHIRPLGHQGDPILDQVCRVSSADFVLCGAREGAVSVDIPKWVIAQFDVGRNEDCLS